MLPCGSLWAGPLIALSVEHWLKSRFQGLFKCRSNYIMSEWVRNIQCLGSTETRKFWQWELIFDLRETTVQNQELFSSDSHKCLRFVKRKCLCADWKIIMLSLWPSKFKLIQRILQFLKWFCQGVFFMPNRPFSMHFKPLCLLFKTSKFHDLTETKVYM